MANLKKKMDSPGLFGRLWTLTNFNEPEMNVFAKDIIRKDAVAGIQMMTLLFFCLLLASAFLDHFVALGGPPLSSYLLLAVLCLHVMLASFRSREIDALYLLALSLLMISCTTLVLMAHKNGSFSPTFYAGVALIFIFIPFVPWGMREASLVTLLLYIVITLSVLSSSKNFPLNSIIQLQFFMLSTAFIILAMVGRNTEVRRNEIMGLFGLKKSHAQMRLLSYKDPLTEIWNRRYLQEKFYDISNEFNELKRNYFFILFDIDGFKQINDTYGHDYGDHILQWTTESFKKCLGPGNYLFRIGGDEFAIIIGNEPWQCLHTAIGDLHKELEKFGKVGHTAVSFSFGMINVASEKQKDLREIYKKADKALYAAKRHQGNWLVEVGDDSLSEIDLNMTGGAGARFPPGDIG